MKKNIKTLLAAFSVLLLITLGSCKKLSSYEYPDETVTAYEMIRQDLNYSIFKYAIERAGLIDLLNGSEAYTVLAPSNGAFTSSGYPQTVIAAMTIPDLQALVKNHIIAGKVDVTAIGASEQKTTLSNQQIFMQRINGSTFVDGADVTNASQEASNGYVNIINKVIVTKATILDAINAYSNTTTNSQFTISIAAITRASTGSTNFTNLLTGTAPYTVFLPNNGAWIDGGYANVAAVNTATPAALETILKNHFVAGAKLTTQVDSAAALNTLSGIKIYIDKGKPSRTTNAYANGILFGNGIASNIQAANGVLHTVGRLIPTPITTNTLDRIKSDATLTIFAAMLKRASEVSGGTNYETLLSDPLKSYTVFAVNNTGMTAAGYATVAAINAENPAKLADIVKYHLIFRRANNINYAENATEKTLLRAKNTAGVESSTTLTFLITGGFKIKGSGNVATISVVTSNIITTNGLLNIVGSLLQP
jgi:uncharacterized surface protein with fasciclin (FAS1) repeats